MSSDDDDTRASYLAGDTDRLLPANERPALEELRVLLASPAVWVEPPPSLEADTVAAIVQAAGAGAPGGRHRRRRRSVWAVPALAAAGMVAAALVAVVIGLGAGGRRAPAQRLAMVVSGTALAPLAHGTATFARTPSGWELHLAVTGLPHLGDGRYYEGWLRDAAGERVAIGTFNDARAVTLWAGVSPLTFNVLTVTVQRVGAGPGKPGARILTGGLEPGRAAARRRR